MTVGEALQKRLEIYDPAPCQRYEAVLAGVTESTDAGRLMLQLPGFRVDMRRIVPIGVRRRWIAQQLKRAILAARRSGG